MPYDVVLVDLEHKSDEFCQLYAKANPLPGARAKVPLLEITQQQQEEKNEGSNDDEQPIYLTESLVVAEYIAETYNVLLPSTTRDRATMRLFTELCGSSFNYFSVLRASNAQERIAAVEALQQNLVRVDAFLRYYSSSGGPFLFGQQFSLAECNAAPFVYRMCIILPAFTGRKDGHDDDDQSMVVDPIQMCHDLDLACLKRWMQAVMTRPSVVKTSNSKEETIERTRRLLERFAVTSK